ncbi:MAG: alpha/beta hydrolase [Oscillospiraceae bacterium]|nr:alpha/beta hydrolase [Oscillospiraceae bacterium]
MFYNAKNTNIKIGNTDIDYISFGKGNRNLIMIPGLGDGLKTVKGAALPIALMYKCFASKYKVYVFSRKNHLEKGYSTRDMAADYKTVMEKLGIVKADIMGISQGGMIAQYIAIDEPELVEKLVLTVTLSRQNETVQKVIGSWLKMAESNDYKSIFIDTTEKSYTEKRLKKYRPLYPLLSKIGKPKDFSRFIIQANACITHDTYDELEKIKCPTLVIGVDNDKIVGVNSSEEIAAKIENSELIIYEGFGHGVYEEAKDFNRRVLDFLSL